MPSSAQPPKVATKVLRSAAVRSRTQGRCWGGAATPGWLVFMRIPSLDTPCGSGPDLFALRSCRWRRFNFCFAQILGSLLRRRGVLVEACSPLEARRLGEPRHELDVPVVMVHSWLLDRGGVDHQVIGWIVEHLVGAHQEVLQGLGQSLINVRRRILKSRFVPLGHDPCFEWKTGRVGSDGQEAVAVGNDAYSGLGLLPEDVAKNAALFVNVILLRAFEFLNDVLGNNGQGDQLPVAMLQGRSRRCPMILEDQDVLEAAVLLQIDDAIAVRPQNVFNSLLRHGSQGGVV